MASFDRSIDWERHYPSVAHAPSSLHTLRQLVTATDFTLVNALSDVPKQWRELSNPLQRRLHPPWSVHRTGRLPQRSPHLEAASRAQSCDRRQPTLGTWPRGSREAIADWPFDPSLFTHGYVLAVPWGFMGNIHVMGTSLPAGGPRAHFAMGRFWNSNSRSGVKAMYGPTSRRPHWVTEKDVDVVVNIESWQGASFQHFVVDALPRLALVYRLLIEARTVWARARVVFDDAPAGRWFLRELKLLNRSLPGIGWAIAAPAIYRARLALFPDYHPPPVPRPSRFDANRDPTFHAKHGVYPRGCLLPIQRALGVFEGARRHLVIYVPRAHVGARSISCSVETEILEGIRHRLWNATGRLQSSAWRVVVPSKSTLASQSAARALFRDAAIVIGAHGGALANVVFCKPGSTLIELYPKASSEHRTSKFCYFGLAQAAGLDHWLIESRSIASGPGASCGPDSQSKAACHGFNSPLNIDPRDVLDAVEHALERHARLTRRPRPNPV